jgi:hypothetical protein
MAIGSLDGVLRTGAALGIEPVISSLAGACLPPLVAFRSATTPNTRIATTAMPSRVRRLGVSQGTAKRSRIIEHPSPRRRAFRLGGKRDGNFTTLVLNSLLEIGGFARDTHWDGHACLGVTHSSQASAEHFQQCAEFLPLGNRGFYDGLSIDEAEPFGARHVYSASQPSVVSALRTALFARS